MEGLLVLLGTVLGVVVLVVLLVAVTMAIGLRLMARGLDRANRVSPKVPTQAPVLWRWSFAQTARQHRRLQRVAAAARAARSAAGIDAPAVSDLAVDLERQACALDDQLVLTARMPTNERLRRVMALDRSVGELEAVAARLAVLALDRTTLPQGGGTLVERVSALEHGRAEVARIQAEALGELAAVDALGRALAGGATAESAPGQQVRRSTR